MSAATTDKPASAVTPGRSSLERTLVEPARGRFHLGVADVWRHRELVYFLTWRDIKVRYKQTIFGASWAILQPFLTMLVFSIVFGRLAHIPSESLPYPIFAFAGLLPWMFFANSLTLGANSIVATPDLVTKIYFPRVTMPLAAVLGGLLDLVLGSLVLIGMMVYYGISPGARALLCAPLFCLAAVAATAVTLWLSALNVKYRDIRYGLPFLVQFWLFATPVAYPSSLMGQPWRTLLGLNPIAGVVEGVRWALLDASPPPGAMVLISAGATIVLLLTGLAYFHRIEDEFADVI